MVPHEHLDMGYTDYQPKVAEIHSLALDEAMQMIDRRPSFVTAPTDSGVSSSSWRGGFRSNASG